MSEWTENGYAKPKILPQSINTEHYEFNAFVSPNEAFLIFSSYGRKDGLGGGDLYMSKKDSNGNWLQAVHLSPPINSKYLDYCPFVDRKEMNFYFTSERKPDHPEIIVNPNEVKSLSNSIQNGFGNIYRINFDSIYFDID